MSFKVFLIICVGVSLCHGAYSAKIPDSLQLALMPSQGRSLDYQLDEPPADEKPHNAEEVPHATPSHVSNQIKYSVLPNNGLMTFR